MAILPTATIHETKKYDETYQFIRAINPDINKHLFCGIPTDGAAPAHTLAALDDKYIKRMVRSNINGFNIFVTINEMNNNQGSKRGNELCTMFRAIFADDDTKKGLKDYPLAPSMIVETSPGKYHVYWLLKPDRKIDRDQYERIQQGLVNHYGGDANARDIARVLRVPGFVNLKEKAKGFVCRIKEITEQRYTWEQIVAAFPQEEVTRATGQIKHEKLDIENTIRMIVTGENTHDAMLSAMGSLHNKGLRDENYMLAIFRGLLNRNHPEFNQRYNIDAPLSARDVFKRREKEVADQAIPAEMFKPTKSHKYTNLPMPGGVLGEIATWVMTRMRYPNETMAIFTAEHLVSAYGGGLYHIEKNTVTRKRIMLAVSAAGKNIISTAYSAIETALSEPRNGNLPWIGEVLNIAGDDSFSFSVQHKQLLENRIRSFIINEAGQGGSSQAGDMPTLRSYQLGALSTKAGETHRPTKQLADENKRLGNVHNGIWLYFHESTLVKYAELLRDSGSYVDGDLSRADLIIADPRRDASNINRSGITGLPDRIYEIFGNLASYMRTTEMSGTTPSNPWIEVDYSSVEKRLLSFEMDMCPLWNKSIDDDDQIAQASIGRSNEKLLTVILLLAIADNEGKGVPVVTNAHLDYAIKRQKAIDSTLHYHYNNGALSSDPFFKCKNEFVEKMGGMISKITNKEQMQKKGMKVGRYQTSGKGRGELQWLMSDSCFSKHVQKGAFDLLVSAAFFGNTKRARQELKDFLSEEKIISPVMEKKADGSGYQLKKRGGWWLNGIIFGNPILKLE